MLVQTKFLMVLHLSGMETAFYLSLSFSVCLSLSVCLVMTLWLLIERWNPVSFFLTRNSLYEIIRCFTDLFAGCMLIHVQQSDVCQFEFSLSLSLSLISSPPPASLSLSSPHPTPACLSPSRSHDKVRLAGR